jgi:hypothetical protein
MSEKARHIDRVIRSPSEVGYVAQVKKSMGMNLKHAPAWDPEEGVPRYRQKLSRLEGNLTMLAETKRKKLGGASK